MDIKIGDIFTFDAFNGSKNYNAVGKLLKIEPGFSSFGDYIIERIDPIGRKQIEQDYERFHKYNPSLVEKYPLDYTFATEFAWFKMRNAKRLDNL